MELLLCLIKVLKMHSLIKNHFDNFIVLSVISQIFLININFIGGPSIKPSQIYFLGLLIYSARSFFNFKFSKSIINYSLASISLISLITFFTLLNYDKQFFFHFSLHEGYEPFVHIVLLAFNLITPFFIYFLMSTYSFSSNILNIFHNSVFYGCLIFFFIIISPIDSSFLYKQTTEIVLRSEVSVQRFIGGVEFSVICAAAITSIINSSTFKNNIYFSLFKILVLCLGLIAGFSRQAILSLIIGIFLTYIINNNRNILQSLTLFFISILSVFISAYYVTLLFAPFLAEIFFERIFSIFQIVSYSTGTIGDRFELWHKMILENSSNIFFGQGLDAYLKFFSFRGEGAHSFPVMIFHAGGIIAFALYLYIQFSVILSLLIFSSKHQVARALLIILIVFFTSSLSNLIYMGHIYWIFIGISYYYVDKLRDT